MMNSTSFVGFVLQSLFFVMCYLHKIMSQILLLFVWKTMAMYCIGTDFFYYNSYTANVLVMLFLCEIQWVFVYPGVLCWYCQIAFKLQSICCHNNSSEVVATCCQNSVQNGHKLGAAVLTTKKPQLHLLHLSRVHITYCKELHLLHYYR
jgi:hypothetical protein